MKQFVTISTIIIFVLMISIGLYYYFFVSTKATAIKAPSNDTTSLFQEVTATQAAKNVQETNELKVTIASPKENATLTQSPTFKIAGATKRNAIIAITGGKQVVLRGVNNDGSFAPDVELTEGINNLTIHVYDQNGNHEEITKTVVYLKDSISSNYTITTGKISPDEIKTTKQTKIYEIAKGVKKTLRTTTQLDEDYPITIIASKDDPEDTLAIMQQTEFPPNPPLVYGKVVDKTVEEEVFNIGITPTDQTENKLIIVDADTTIRKTDNEKDSLRGSDIKISDKVIAVLEDPETNKAVQVLIIPGQAAGILKDVKQD